MPPQRVQVNVDGIALALRPGKYFVMDDLNQHAVPGDGIKDMDVWFYEDCLHCLEVISKGMVADYLRRGGEGIDALIDYLAGKAADTLLCVGAAAINAGKGTHLGSPFVGETLASPRLLFVLECGYPYSEQMQVIKDEIARRVSSRLALFGVDATRIQVVTFELLSKVNPSYLA